MDFNQIIQVGRLTDFPQHEVTPSGTTVAKFSLANDHPYTENQTCYFNCVVFGKLAETILNFCQKGDEILIEGYLIQEKFVDKYKQKRQKYFINVQKMKFGRKSQKNQSIDQPALPNINKGYLGEPAMPKKQNNAIIETIDLNDDIDIPF